MDSKATLSGLPGDAMTGYRMSDTTNLRSRLHRDRFENYNNWIVKRTIIITFLFTFIFLSSSIAQIENPPTYLSTIDPVKAEALELAGWKGAYLNIAGSNILDGVEVLSQLNTCNSKDVIFIKLINHNDSDVKIELLGGIYTKDRQWIENPEGMKSITIKANEEVIRDCSNNNRELLYISSVENFKRYAPSSFEVTLVR